MLAVEFLAQVRDGVIEIPAQYRDKVKEKVRVIILTEEEKGETTNLIEQLLQSPLDAPGFRPLSRDETHARA